MFLIGAHFIYMVFKNFMEKELKYKKILLFKENGLSEWITIYGKILDGLNFMLSEFFERVGEVYGDRKKE